MADAYVSVFQTCNIGENVTQNVYFEWKIDICVQKRIIFKAFYANEYISFYSCSLYMRHYI